MAKKSMTTPSGCAECAKLEKTVRLQARRIARLTSTQGAGAKQIFFDEKSLAIRVGVSVKTLQSWRTKGEGPKFTKLNRAVRYRLQDISAFERSLKTGSNAKE